jgi:hypothetical protein
MLLNQCVFWNDYFVDMWFRILKKVPRKNKTQDLITKLKFLLLLILSFEI